MIWYPTLILLVCGVQEILAASSFVYSIAIVRDTVSRSQNAIDLWPPLGVLDSWRQKLCSGPSLERGRKSADPSTWVRLAAHWKEKGIGVEVKAEPERQL
ncbi:hypothetical protein GH714_037334 [Hevea brasiliensis]|uniref:Aminotransferase-like plant mobile domain-containing protein n=1 Tax=Hevea brasiliensis TaxID=3981 RepID=A0A6A6L779_HEVBR|nr:hypothetical protein GH714_037334 [Hevea brasiliensis]